MSEPTVTVIIAVYNDAARLPRAVASIQAQTFTDWEIVIASDGSTDDTLEIARALAAADPRIRVLDLPHAGAARARNAAASAARGNWLAILDSDDQSAPERLERQVDCAQVHPTVGVVSTYGMRLSPDGHEHGVVWMGPTSLEAFRAQRLRAPVYIINGTALIRRDDFIAAGGYPEDYRVNEDLALYNLRLIDRCDFLTLPEPLVWIEMHPGSLSRYRAAEIVEGDEVVRENLRRKRRGMPVLGYRAMVRALEGGPLLHRLNRRRRQLRQAWFARGAARLSAGSSRGLPHLALAVAVAPIWSAQMLASRVRAFRRAA